MCLEKEKQLTRGNEFGIEHIDPQSIPKDLAILIETMFSNRLVGPSRLGTDQTTSRD